MTITRIDIDTEITLIYSHKLKYYASFSVQIDFQIVSAQFLINKSSRRRIKTAFFAGFTISLILTCSIIYLFSAKGFIQQALIFVIAYGSNFLVIYWYINGVIIMSVMETFLTELQVCT